VNPGVDRWNIATLVQRPTIIITTTTMIIITMIMRSTITKRCALFCHPAGDYV